jgi:aspartokinase
MARQNTEPLIGNELSKACGVGKEVFGVLDPFNIRMICYGASSHVDVVIKKPGSSPAIGIVYRAKEFYSNKL